jgi:hypothetical protein
MVKGAPVWVYVGKRAIWAAAVKDGPMDVGGHTAMADVLAGATEVATAPVAEAGKTPLNYPRQLDRSF